MKRLIFCSIIVILILLIVGCLSKNNQIDITLPEKKSMCSQLNGFTCSETSTETCLNKWLEVSDTSRCCSSTCISQPVCNTDSATGKPISCQCQPNENKNKVTILIKKNGIYDNNNIERSMEIYFVAVKNNLEIENIGISKFEGNNIEELDEYIDNLYLDKDVAYIILLGDDLPVADVTESEAYNQHAIYSKLQYVSREYTDSSCRDLAISWILPPIYYPTKQKQQFVQEILDRYAQYHNNPKYYFSKFKQDILRIKHDNNLENIGDPLLLPSPKYNLPITEVLNSKHEEIRFKLSEKHFLLIYDVHGSQDSIGLGINYRNLKSTDYSAFYTSLEEFSNFVSENGQPALFVDAGACQATTIKSGTQEFCCWPQIMLKLGIWAYYSWGGGGDDIPNIQRDLSTGKPIGYVIRQDLHIQNFIFGDILAYFPIEHKN